MVILKTFPSGVRKKERDSFGEKGREGEKKGSRAIETMVFRRSGEKQRRQTRI
jgi:hypothetical protein